MRTTHGGPRTCCFRSPRVLASSDSRPTRVVTRQDPCPQQGRLCRPTPAPRSPPLGGLGLALRLR
eukprot:6253944-Alexandrium_andersonii.AAC.1